MTTDTTDIKKELAANAKIIQEAEKAKKTGKKPAAKKATAKPAKSKAAKKDKKKMSSTTSKKPKKEKKAKPVKAAKALEILPKIEDCKDAPERVMARRVTLSESGSSLKLDPKTTAGESVLLFDYISHDAAMGTLRLGDLINQSAELESFKVKGKSMYAAAMASTGRSMDRLRTLASVARNTPESIRKLADSAALDIGVEHLREVARVPLLEDKKAIIKECVSASKEGKPLNVAKVRAMANKIVPPKKKKPAKKSNGTSPAKETRDMTADESQALMDIEDAAAKLEALIGGASFVLEIDREKTITLREKLERIARFAAQLT